MKRIFSMMLAIITTAGVLVAQPNTKDPKAGAILDEMSKKYKELPSFKAKFAYTLESPMANMKETSEGEIIVKGGKFHLKMGGQEIINNGTTVWTYLKDANEVNVSSYEPDEDDITPTKIYSIYKNGYKYYHVEEVTIAGKTYDVIELVPENLKTSLIKIRMEIDKKEKTIKGWKIFEKNGNRYTYEVKSFDPNYKATDAEFNFDTSKYPKVEVVDLR
ncbi:MAG TPA: outer membrane lipoprotein carrier protein LolA [Cytophagaceae bacterium]